MTAISPKHTPSRATGRREVDDRSGLKMTRPIGHLHPDGHLRLARPVGEFYGDGVGVVKRTNGHTTSARPIRETPA
jgi:hypothetical protein